MNKKTLLALAITLSAIGSQAQAFFSFGVSSGFSPCYAPEPRMHVGFGGCGDDIGFGFGFDVPLRPRRVCYEEVYCAPAPIVTRVVRRPAPRRVIVEEVCCLDDAGKTYWTISNDTERPIKVENCNGRSKVIQPGETRKLSHESGYELRVSFRNNDNIYADTTRENHYISIQCSNGGILVN